MRRFPKLETTYAPEVVKLVKQALEQIGDIEPWFDKDMGCWRFEHPDFPESYGGESEEEVKQGYPLYLANMFQAQLENNLAPYIEEKIHFRGGKRPGAGRPKGTTKGPRKVAIKVEPKMAAWLKDPAHLKQVEKLMG